MKDGLYRIIKRMIDVIGSLVGLIVFSPIIMVIIIAIKLDDGQKIIFKQKRVGKDGKEFVMYKFRSMIPNAHSKRDKLMDLNHTGGPIFKIQQDPRITKVGTFLRAHSLDEIPQFINVLKGDMSMVGPRPALPEEVQEYTDAELTRLQVLPGLTGLWQVSGRSNLTYQEMISLDIAYIEDKNIILDLVIIWKTVLQMFTPSKSGAF
ncbi:sugar transferase [Leuconostoc mesenteroides]|uniref:Sugar transferase n=1 Tax=Leuconostoc mesenteroides TaxID=1245 RepID=A0A843Z3T9_LEUME|nr:sugar transferase [Leuconostoc mesenteroides]MQR27468.1 sugar transferase [Leuconostoc mesenteroides]